MSFQHSTIARRMALGRVCPDKKLETKTCSSLIRVARWCLISKYRKANLAAFKALGPQFVERTRTEPGCMHYAFSFNGTTAHCREGYANAEAVLAHLQNVGELLGQALQIAKIVRLEVHAPAVRDRETPRADGFAQPAVFRTGAGHPAQPARPEPPLKGPCGAIPDGPPIAKALRWLKFRDVIRSFPAQSGHF
jgi:hypothetical protein